MTTSVFERMLAAEERQRFLDYRTQRLDMYEDELAQLTSYLPTDECTRDIERILANDFSLPLPRKVLIRKANTNRRRTLFIYPPRQQMLFSYLTWQLHDYDYLFSDSLYSFRKGKKTSALFEQVMRIDSSQDLWIFKSDIRDYFYSIKPWHLIPMLEQHVGSRDPLLLSFLKHLLTNNTYLWNDVEEHGYMGGLQGVPMAMMFGNMYLMELDSALDRRSILNARYSDDIAAFMNTREEVDDAFAEAREILSRLELEFNERKTQVLAPGESLELLGIQLRDGNFDIGDNTLAKARYKLKRFAHKLVIREQKGELSRKDATRIMIDRLNRYFYGHESMLHKLNWKSFFFMIVTRPDSLHELDLYVQDLVRYVATGKKTNAKYRMTYDAMRDLGYKPLVHEYYKFREEMYQKQLEPQRN
ncbi:MAG: hypothetical protein J6D34_11300 [Atopobiaceae bacterium]|nr:hypothetical protein [Atopobiaceae bacterium]